MIKANIALVHDWMTGQRGGEKVLEVLAELYPNAPIFTLFHFKGSQIADVEKRDIRTSFLQKMPFVRRHYRWYLPLYPVAAELLDLQDFDFVISSSHCAAKGVIPAPDALHISYIHSPMRYAWNQYHAYFSPRRLNVFNRMLIPPVIHWLRIWDESSSRRVDEFIANSRAVARRIRRYYRRESDIIHPPADTDFFKPGSAKSEHFLIVSALVPYKRIDMAVRAFNRTRLPLKIIGTGPEYRKLKRDAGANIEFLGEVTPQELLLNYQEAQALIMPGEEDFGINVLEAQACGTPVIALGRGGALETVQSGQTGLLFSPASVAGLTAALDKFGRLTFNKNLLRENALRFSRESFKNKMDAYLQHKYMDFVKRHD
jgi:glycosyltransferase involved in cell wall biosynthesis